jgi:DNA-binding Lrp family transcriptional regulator
MTFTKNEKGVLKLLLGDGRMADVEMSEKLRISTQAVGRIRKKLEDTGVIEGYSCMVNYEKVGLSVFAVTLTKLKEQFWKEGGELDSGELLKQSPFLFACLLPGSDVSLISLQAFRNLNELDRYFHLLKTRKAHHQEASVVYTFSALNMLRTSQDLVSHVLDDKPIVP